MISLPPSFFVYRDPKRKPAIDRAIATKRVAGSLTVDQCRETYAARGLGEAIKAEFWCFLYDLWEAAWAKPLAGLEAIPVGDPAWEGEAYGPDESWRYRRLSNGHRLDPRRFLFSGVQVLEGTGVRLLFSVWEQGPRPGIFVNVTPRHQVDGPWKREDRSGSENNPTFWTPPGLVMPNDKGAVETDRLAKAAADAAKALRAAVKASDKQNPADKGGKPSKGKAGKANGNTARSAK